ncbi:heterokaryon incompatibility protein-domain-containing protein [Leptodontidium sp. MPI-SDFR-AT-0119]|nr:heterokaryon incompatibility protein-domain-containing protein [Leptodontidium sp. MPI-SDFR-AT-0119]
MIKGWLETCLKNHPECRTVAHQMPSRLVFLDENRARLIDTSILQNKPLYATLSHCWGTKKILQLTRNNMTDRRIEIPEVELSQTFKDALHIIRQLGFAYIWIDSLCIVQDWPEDWCAEASKMSGVYGGSALNIAASAANDGSVGCFFSREDQTLRRLSRHRIQIPVGVPARDTWVDCLDATIFRSCVEQSPLASRSWAFQERFLAPRTIHFTKWQVYWECKTNIACETYRDSLPKSKDYHGFERRDTELLWCNIVRKYSGCKLTLWKDKLVAISGVAKSVHSLTGDEYVAGLWKKRLEAQLLWHTSNNERISSNLPSWTWASLKGQVSPANLKEERKHQMNVICRVADIQLNFTGDDTYGEITSGILRLVTQYLCGPFFLVRREFGNTWTCRVAGQEAEYELYEDISSSGNRDGWFILPVVHSVGISEGLLLECATVPGYPSGCFRRIGAYKSGRGTDGIPWYSECWADESLLGGIAENSTYPGYNNKYFINLI